MTSSSSISPISIADTLQIQEAFGKNDIPSLKHYFHQHKNAKDFLLSTTTKPQIHEGSSSSTPILFTKALIYGSKPATIQVLLDAAEKHQILPQLLEWHHSHKNSFPSCIITCIRSEKASPDLTHHVLKYCSRYANLEEILTRECFPNGNCLHIACSKVDLNKPETLQKLRLLIAHFPTLELFSRIAEEQDDVRETSRRRPFDFLSPGKKAALLCVDPSSSILESKNERKVFWKKCRLWYRDRFSGEFPSSFRERSKDQIMLGQPKQTTENNRDCGGCVLR